MKIFNDITALNHQLREDRAAVAQRRWQAVQNIADRRERAEERTQRLAVALDAVLIVAMLMAIIALAVCAGV